MKKIFLLFIFITVVKSYSQNTELPSVSQPVTPIKTEINKSKTNEFKLDFFYLIFAGALNISYEHILNEESGIGANLILSSGEELNTTFSLTPYYRFYFGRKPAAGFFFEGFTSINSFKYDVITDSNGLNSIFYGQVIERKSTTDLGVGFGLGGKWVTKNGFIFEINSGIGRNLLNNYTSGNSNGLKTSDKIFGRGGVSFGYRF